MNHDFKFLLFYFEYFLERKDCKWDVLDTNDQPVEGASVVYYNDEFEIKAMGFSELEKMYILKGANDSEKFVYFSEKETNGDDGNWNPPKTSSIVRTVAMTSPTVHTVSTNYEELRKCPSGFKPYSQHSLKPSAIKLIVTGLNSVQGTFTDYSVHCVTDYYAHLLFCCKPG